MFRDGPLTRRAPETIRYGTGRCSLGALLVASSDKGIVTIMVRDTRSRLIRDLEARFPKAKLVPGGKNTVAKVAKYIAAPFRPFALPLDIRGTDLQQRVWREVRKIPFGETSTYTKIAAAIGSPKAIRAVASSCSRSWFAFAVPCHRVLHTGARREGRQYDWVQYEAKLAAKLQRFPPATAARAGASRASALVPVSASARRMRRRSSQSG
jgi:AraC family transcriptional regulator of adaptative response/methylated-DNA-[protein]-cysteine methyltransferase